MDLQILSSNPGCNGSFLLGPFSPFPCDCVVEKMTDSSQFSLDGLAEDQPDSVLVCEEEEEVSYRLTVNCLGSCLAASH
jgi:hypothetical protein